MLTRYSSSKANTPQATHAYTDMIYLNTVCSCIHQQFCNSGSAKTTSFRAPNDRFQKFIPRAATLLQKYHPPSAMFLQIDLILLLLPNPNIISTSGRHLQESCHWRPISKGDLEHTQHGPAKHSELSKRTLRCSQREIFALGISSNHCICLGLAWN